MTATFQTYFGAELLTVFALLERDDWGVKYGLHLHPEEKLPFRPLRPLRQAGSKVLDPETNFFGPKVVWANPFNKYDVANVPCAVPSVHRVTEVLNEIVERHDLKRAADGQIIYVDVDVAVQQLQVL